MLINGLYYFFAGLVAIAALIMLFTPHVFYAALCLMVTSIGLAAIYFLQGAAFIGITYLLVYAGGVLVTIVFALFLLKPQAHPNKKLYYALTGLVLGIAIMPVYQWSINLMHRQSNIPVDASAYSLTALGYQLFGTYALLIEITGIFLLLALVGSLYVLQKKDPEV